MRRAVRRFVATTESLPGLRQAYRGIYDRAVSRLLSSAFDSNETAAVYSRNSFADGSYRPGMSDVDLLWVLRDDGSRSLLEDRVRTLCDRSLPMFRRFPMLGPFQIATEKDFARAWDLGFLPMETYAWRLEAGDELLDGRAGRTGIAHAGVERAFQVYAAGFHGNIRGVDLHGSGPHFELERSYKKILRSLGRELEPPSRRHHAAAVIADTMLLVDNALTRSADDLNDKPAHEFQVSGLELQEAATLSVADETSLPVGVLGLVSASPDGKQVFAVIDPARPRSEVTAAVRALLEQPNLGPSRLVFMTPQLWTILLRENRPALWFTLAARRYTAGADLFSNDKAPTTSGVLQWQRQEASWVLLLALTIWMREATGNRTVAALLPAIEQRVAALEVFARSREILYSAPADPLEFQGSDGVPWELFDRLDAQRRRVGRILEQGDDVLR